MHKVDNLDLNSQRILGNSAFNYPDDYKFPISVLVREAFVSNRNKFESGAEFTIPGYGVLTTKGRAWTFRPTREYAGKKGYADEMSGVWA